MKKLKSLALSLSFSALVFTSCVSANEEELLPQEEEVENVSFATDIVPLLTTNCTGCHSNATKDVAGAGIGLEDYADVKSSVDSGKFWAAINHDASASPMPKFGSKMDATTLNVIKSWIDQGALDN